MINGLVGKKLGMASVYDENKNYVPVTAIEALPCAVTQIKTKARDGYSAVQLGYATAKSVNKPTTGHLGKSGIKTNKFVEIRLDDDETELKIGDKVDCSIFEAGQMVKVSAYSKGRGFAGGVRRYGFRGGPKTHGQSDRHRAPGSIGAGSSPGRTLPGTRMSGHYGNEKITTKGLKLVNVLAEDNVLLVKGAVPGARNGIIIISKQVSE